MRNPAQNRSCDATPRVLNAAAMRTPRRHGRLLMALLVLALAPGCKSSVSLVPCETLMDDVYAAGGALTGVNGEALDRDGAAALCIALEAEAGEADCVDGYERWFGCVEASIDATASCHRDLLAAQACVDDAPYEHDCADAEDGDGDGSADCGDPDCLDSAACALEGMRIPQSGADAVDVVLVVDFHESMVGPHAAISERLYYLMDELRTDLGSLRDVHLGIVSPDLGVGGQSVPGCADPPGNDAGKMVAGGCTGLGGAGYFIDVAPRDCQLTREGPNNRCVDHDCTAANCAHEPDASFVLDELDCPRCRNFGLLPDNLFDCVIGLPKSQCPYRQPLEAMRLALDSHLGNAGFRREDAHLAVVLLSNSDDCSANGADLFDPTDPSPTGPLGPLTEFRCFEHGVTCQETGRDPGERHGCAPTTDAAGLLHPLGRYTDFLDGLAHPAMMTVAAVGGPVLDDTASVTTDASGNPALASSCGAGTEHATPGFRLRAFSDHYNDLDGAFWPYSPICGEVGAALRGVGQNVAAALNPPCTAAPLLGCTDPGAVDSETCNDECRPDCWVVEVTGQDEPDEARSWLPHCLQVCSSGLCPGNQDPAEAYANGHPDLRDPDLPVEACWRVAWDPRCTEAREAGLRIARRADPPARTFAYATCTLSPAEETDCGNGQDDDGDCLVDQDDPDCNG